MRELRSPVVLPALGLVAVLLPGGCSSAGYGPFCRGAAGDLEMGGAGEELSRGRGCSAYLQPPCLHFIEGLGKVSF